MEIENYLDFAEGSVKLDGFDDCIIGISESFGEDSRIIYSKDSIIKKLMIDMTEEDAVEYYYFNIVGGFFGERNPIFIQDFLC
jgi:hypothetical protein